MPRCCCVAVLVVVCGTAFSLLAPPRFARAQTGAAAAAGDVLAPGGLLRPALTQKRVDDFRALLEYALGGRLTPNERDHFQQRMIALWPNVLDWYTLTGGFAPLNLVRVNANTRDLLTAGTTEGYTDLTYQKYRAYWLQQLRALGDDPDAKWQLQVYARIHKPLAPGNPPLTREASDAFAEMLAFRISQVGGAKPRPVTQEFKNAIAQSLAAKYTALPSARQKRLAEARQEWAQIRNNWPHTPEISREELRAEWGKELEPTVPEIRPISRARRARLAKAQADAKAAWAKMTPAQKLYLLQLRGQTMQMTIDAMNSSVANHNDAMNRMIDDVAGRNSVRYQWRGGKLFRVTPGR